MLNRLQKKWNVSGGRLLLIISTFAIGGSLCGYAGRKLLSLSGLEKGFLWIVLYILLVTLLWPLAVLLVSVPFGQFSFFRKYLQRVFARMSGKAKAANVIRIAIFASGAGTNAKRIIETLPEVLRQGGDLRAEIVLIVSDKTNAGVLKVAHTHKIAKEVLGYGDSAAKDQEKPYLDVLKMHSIDFIVLAGFLKKIPPAVVQAYPRRILNIHPALLPKYGGKGMYGRYVHEAVIAAGEPQSGISIHYVDEIYDHGEVIFRAACDVAPGETAESLAAKIHVLEHQHYTEVIAKLLYSQNPR